MSGWEVRVRGLEGYLNCRGSFAPSGGTGGRASWACKCIAIPTRPPSRVRDTPVAQGPQDPGRGTYRSVCARVIHCAGVCRMRPKARRGFG